MIDFFTAPPNDGTIFTPCRTCILVCIVILYTMGLAP